MTEFIRYPIENFHLSRALWAANKFVLWPLGLALTIRKEDDGTYSDFYVSEWSYPPGEAERIDAEDDAKERAEFIQFALGRIANMKPEEHVAALARLRVLIPDLVG